MITLRKTLPMLLGLSLSLSFNAAYSETIMLEKTIAVVDRSVVLRSDFDDRKRAILQRLEGQLDQLPPMEILDKQILEQLILEQLQKTEAMRYGMNVSDYEVNQTINNVMASGGHASMEALTSSLIKEGSTLEALREQISQELLINNVQQGVVNNRIQITEQEVDHFLESSDGKSATSPDYHIGHILLAAPSSTDATAIKAAEEKAQELFTELQAGADFGTLAITHSNDQAALNGGDLGWRKFSQLPEIFSTAIGKLAVGEVSAPIRSGAGFHLIKNIEQRGGGELLIEQTLARHILIKTSEIMDDVTAQAELNKIRTRIENGEEFAALAREKSEDIGSMLNGGELGWSTPGMFVPEFDAAMDTSNINQITDPFKSQFGWHILQVMERRKEDMSDNVIRNKAVQLLRSRRFDEELQLWQTELRENAFIEIKDSAL